MKVNKSLYVTISIKLTKRKRNARHKLHFLMLIITKKKNKSRIIFREEASVDKIIRLPYNILNKTAGR